MILRTILAGLLLSACTLSLSALDSKETKKPDGKKEKPGKAPEHTCALNITWWEEPVLKEGETLELGIFVDKEFQAISIQAMTIGKPFDYTGGPDVVIARKAKVTTKDKKGNPVTKDDWVPFANFVIKETDTDVLALLMPAHHGLGNLRHHAPVPTHGGGAGREAGVDGEDDHGKAS